MTLTQEILWLHTVELEKRWTKMMTLQELKDKLGNVTVFKGDTKDKIKKFLPDAKFETPQELKDQINQRI